MSTETLSVTSPTGELAASGAGLAPSGQNPILRKILVPVDFSAASLKALNYALALGDRAHTEVQLIYVLEPASRFSGLDTLPIAVSDDEIVDSCEHDLSCLADENQLPGWRPTTSVVIGNPAHEVIKLARALPADLIVLSTHGRTGLKHLLLGSVAERIVRESPCPVLVVRKHERDFARVPGKHERPLALSKILVPTDFSAPAEVAVRQAVQFAGQYGGRITLLHNIPYPYLPGQREFMACDEGSVLFRHRTAAESALEKLADRLLPPDLRADTVVLMGAPLAQIPDFAAMEGFDLIICGTHGRTGFRHFFLGSIAEGLVRHALCPVMVVGPAVA